SLEQVADVGFPGREQRVGLDVPRSDRETPRAARRLEVGAASGTDLQVVLEHDRLPVEQEAESGVVGDELEDAVDEIDETRAKGLVRPVPLAVPVRVRDEDALHVRAAIYQTAVDASNHGAPRVSRPPRSGS